MAAANSGDTIQLSEGNYTLYKVPSEGHTKGKNLTFVGQRTDKTGWNIGGEVPDPTNFGREYIGDYSFDGAVRAAQITLALSAPTILLLNTA